MSLELSIYLDAVRFAAALAVLVSHLSGIRFTGGLFWQADAYGDEAVDIFFVLSGFVIAHVCQRRETTLRGYAASRLARVYSVALPALAITFLLDAVGTAVRPDLYAYVPHATLLQFLTGVTFVSRLWWADVQQGTNIPYWSLTYEVWYYIIFACICFSRGRWKAINAAAAMLVAGPNIVSLLPLWLIGVASYYACQYRLSGPLGAALCLGATLLWLIYEITAWQGHRLVGAELPWALTRKQIIQDYLIGTLFAVHLVGFNAISSIVAPLLLWCARPIRWAAGATFTIYLFHVPVAQFATTVVPWAPAWWLTRLVMFPGVLAVLFVIAEVTERRKTWWLGVFQAALSTPSRMAAP